MATVINKRGKGAPELPAELKRTAKLPIRLSDKEKEALVNYTDQCGAKMAEVLRDAVRRYLASEEIPPNDLAHPERQDHGFEPRNNLILISMTQIEKDNFDSFIARHGVKATALVRYALRWSGILGKDSWNTSD